jgi:ABC-type Fe3+-hydroxamate transport system substrate-binding protein
VGRSPPRSSRLRSASFWAERLTAAVRVVSLVPSSTETLLAWGVDVVACTRFCEQPRLLHVGGTKDPDIDAIVALAPDLVVVDREENRLPDAQALEAAGLSVHVTHVTALDQVPETLTALQRAVRLDPALETVRLPSIEPTWATAFVPIWKRPWMTINRQTYGASLLSRLGIETAFADHPDRYPTVDVEQIRERRPLLVVLPSEPYPFAERHLAEVAALVPDARSVLIDGQDLFWWGSRTPEALERLRVALNSAR